MAKKDKPTPEYDSERETKVLLEDMNKSIKTVAEGHTILVKNQEEIKDELETVKMAVMENSRDIKVVKSDVKELKEGQKRLEQKLDTVTTDHENHIRKLEAIKS